MVERVLLFCAALLSLRFSIARGIVLQVRRQPATPARSGCPDRGRKLRLAFQYLCANPKGHSRQSPNAAGGSVSGCQDDADGGRDLHGLAGGR